MKRIQYWLVSFFLFGLVSCKKEVAPLSSTPLIYDISISSSQITAFKDSLVVEFMYRDGDGDLGENLEGVRNAFLIDSRNGLEYGFRIPQLAPSNSTIPIQGKLELKMKNVGIEEGVTEETFTFEAYVIDREGHESNKMQTPPIRIRSE